jgi:hypothetical protein
VFSDPGSADSLLRREFVVWALAVGEVTGVTELSTIAALNAVDGLAVTTLACLLHSYVFHKGCWPIVYYDDAESTKAIR